MRVPIFGTRGVFKNCVFYPWCYCSNTLLVVRKPAEFDFQLLHENPQLWWLFLHVFILGNNFILCIRGNTLASCFIVPSFLYSPLLSEVVWEFCVYQDLTKSLILTFFSNLWKNWKLPVLLSENRETLLIFFNLITY